MRAERSSSGSAGGRLAVVDVGQVDVVAGDTDLDAPLGQLADSSAAASERRSRIRAGTDRPSTVGDPLGQLGDGVVAELADGDHVGAQAVHHQ